MSAGQPVRQALLPAHFPRQVQGQPFSGYAESSHVQLCQQPKLLRGGFLNINQPLDTFQSRDFLNALRMSAHGNTRVSFVIPTEVSAAALGTLHILRQVRQELTACAGTESATTTCGTGSVSSSRTPGKKGHSTHYRELKGMQGHWETFEAGEDKPGRG